MAKALEIDKTYLSQLENGRKPVDDFYLSKAEGIEKANTIKEEVPGEYRTSQGIAVELIPPEMLEPLWKHFQKESHRVQGSERMRYQEAAIVITREQTRRGLS